LTHLPKCNTCGHETITREGRINELKAKIEEQRKARSLKSAKWSNWVKNHSVRYAKMGVYCQNWKPLLDEEEKQVPMLTDENLTKIMKEMEEEEKRKEEKKKEAEQIKEKGNNYIGLAKYKAAHKKYTQAIELSKGYLILYTNRALASLKMGRWYDVVEDCTRVLSHCECFDEGYTKEKDLCFKALARRAVGWEGMRKYDLAKSDAEEALKLNSGLEETIKLIKKINENIEIEKKLIDIIKSNKANDTLQYINK